MIDQNSIKNLFTGGMDLDIDPQLLSDGDYLRATNIRNQINGTGKGNLVTNVKGNTLVPYTQPTGINKAIGAYKNAADSSIIFMVYNSLGNHQIRRYNADNTIDLIMEHDFGWEADKYITNINLIDDLLYWTDTECRKINIKKAFNGDKKLCWDVVLTSGVSTFVFYFNGGIFFSKSYNFPTDSYQDIVNDLTVEFDNRGNNMEAKLCAGSIEICQTADNNGHTLELVASEGIAIPKNFYQGIVRETWFSGKAPQNCMPKIELKLNRDVTYDFITDKVFQFRTRIVYDDYEKSVLSPISDINIPLANQSYNFIEVDFTEPRLLDATQLGLIRGVEIFVRVTNEGIWKLIKFIPNTELWIDSGRINNTTFNFYNDSITTALDNATANRQFDALPISPTDDEYSICQESADSRIVYANFTENYERPCYDADIGVGFIPSPTPKVFNITGIIRIQNNNFFGPGISGRNGMIYQLDPTTNEWPVFGGINQGSNRDGIGTDSDQYLPANGFAVYLAGLPYFAISRQIEIPQLPQNDFGIVDGSTLGALTAIKDFYAANPTQDVFSTYSIQGLVPGKYVLRIANHRCGFGDPMGRGSMYDLNKWDAIQKTSTFTKRFIDSSTGNQIGKYEITVEILPNGTFTVGSPGSPGSISGVANADGDIYVGEAEVSDVGGVESNTLSYCGFLLDADANANKEEIKKGLFCEEQIVKLTNVDTYETTTDHNGFWYFEYVAPTASTVAIQALSNNVSGSRLILNDFSNNSKYIGPNKSALLDLYSSGLLSLTAAPFPVQLIGIANGPYIEYILPNTETFFSNNLTTTVIGKVVDSTGAGIPNLNICYERNGRQEVTDSNGDFSIVVYVDAIQNLNQRVQDSLIINSPIGIPYTFVNSGLFWDDYLLLISQFVTDYNSTTFFEPLFLNNIVADILAQIRRNYLKMGGRYKFAIRDVDGINRRCALYTEEDYNIYIPFTTEDINKYYPTIPSQQADGYFNLTLTINSQPPIWSEYLYIYRTLDGIYGDYLQFPVSDVKYVQYYDSTNDVIIETTFDARNAKEIYLQFEQSLLNYQDFESGSNKSWIYSEGDRIRLIRTDNGSLFPEFIDLPILDVRDGYYIIEATDALGDIKIGTLVEVYTPKIKVDDDIEEQMFEIPICVKVLDPGTPSRRYENTVIPLNTGDTYRRSRIVPVPSIGTVIRNIEDNSISDFFASRDEDIGRFDILDDTFGRLIRTNAYRFSNRYEAGTKLNGLSSFEGANVTEIGRNFGAVKSLKLTNDGNEREVILSIFENRCISIYVGAAIFNDLAETDIVALSSQVLGAYRALKGDFGTTNPESVWLEDGNVRWWDGLRRKFCQYGINGLIATSDYKIRSYAASIPDGNKVVSVYDEYYGEWIATVLSEIPETIAFNDQINRWVSFYSFTPEIYSSSGRSVVSFKDGTCWVHDTNPIRNNFYGVQYVSQLNCVSRVEPISTKMFLRARVQGSKWYMPTIQVLPNDSYPFGMLSRLLKDNWALKEGEYWANFLRDINDPLYQSNIQLAIFEGRKLRGQVLVTLLENDQTTEATIRMLEVYSVTSERGNA